MEFLSKEFISRLISEQVENYELSEMALNAAWAPSKLPEQLTLNVNDIRGKAVNALDSKTGESLPSGVIKSDIVRTSPSGDRIIQFMNVESGVKATRYVQIDDNNNVVTTFTAPPRLAKFGTDYEKVSMDTKIDKRIDKLATRQQKVGWDKMDSYQRDLVRDRIESSQQDEQAKRKLVFPIINKFFGQKSIVTHLDKCGIPEINANSQFTEPTSNINQLSPERSRESQFCGPNIYYNFHTVRDDDDVQDAIDKIMNFRMSVEMGEKPKGQRQLPGKMVRQYAGQVYAGGKWDPSQRAADKSQFELTPIYKLYKQAVQKGEKAFNVISDLTVIGKIVNRSTYMLNAVFTATNQVRTITSVNAGSRGNLFEPIRVSVSHEIQGDEPMNCIENTELFRDLYVELFQQLTTKILQIEPDAILEKLLYEPSEVVNMNL